MKFMLRGPWLLVCAGCEAKVVEPQDRDSRPAHVAIHPAENDLATIALTPEAEERLGIRVAPLEVRPVGRTRLRGGRVVVPPGQALAVLAPVAGALQGVDDPPRPGEVVARGQPIFHLAPLLAPDARAALEVQGAAIEGDAIQADAELAAAEEALRRAEALMRDGAGSQRAVEEARATRAGAAARLAAARSKQDALSLMGDAGLIEIAAPLGGLLRAVHAAPGQGMPAGALLFELEDLGRVWIRVPVYVADAGLVRADAAATAEGGLTLRPIAAPPSADPTGATLDLYYEVENAEGRLRPGQSVLVELPLLGETEESTVPSSALLRDVQGGTWVYARLEAGSYARRRVLVDRVVDGIAVLRRGPDPGTEVVVAGAAELFGTEFFVSK
jgi:RND family efflux transporter MFP subunit